MRGEMKAAEKRKERQISLVSSLGETGGISVGPLDRRRREEGEWHNKTTARPSAEMEPFMTTSPDNLTVEGERGTGSGAQNQSCRGAKGEIRDYSDIILAQGFIRYADVSRWKDSEIWSYRI